MRTLFVMACILAFASGTIFISCKNHSAVSEKTPVVMDSTEKVKRGEYLVRLHPSEEMAAQDGAFRHSH